MAEQKQNSVQIDILGNIYNNIRKGLAMGKDLIMLQGSARCFAPGTKVRMYDGSLKCVEDIVVGDRLMDMSGIGYNTVAETHRGTDMMYRIHPAKGQNDIIVNSSHILSLKQTEAFRKKVNGKFVAIPFNKDEILNIPVSEYIQKPPTFKRKYSLFKNTLLQMPERELSIDPYYLGVWIGDGTSRRWFEISNSDKEILDWFYDFAKGLNTKAFNRERCTHQIKVWAGGKKDHRINEKVHQIGEAFKTLNLINNKHIPNLYLYNSYENRLKLLAGLLDSDGYITKRGTISITQKNKQIAESIVELCNTCGFYTNGIVKKTAKMKRKDGSVYECEVYIVEINHNNFNDLNKYMRVERKKVKDKDCKRDYFVTKPIVTEEGVGEYYGFSLCESPYLLDNQGITVHNSGKTYNTLIYIILECLQNPIRERKVLDPISGRMLIKKEPLRVSIVRNSLPVIKRSVYEDFKTIMINMGQWEDRRMNRTDYIYTFPNGATIEFFSAEDEQKLRGPWRHILYINEANEIYYYSFSMLRQRTYEYTIVDYNPSFTEEHWLFPLMKDERSYHFISTYKDNIFLPAPAVREIESYQTTNPALWQIFGKGEFAIVEGLVFPKENWDIIEDDAFPTWLGEEYIGIDWGFTCFSGDTLITTDKGQVRIDQIKAGNMVLTRNGYKPVLKAICKGEQEVIKKEINIDGEKVIFVSTNNHKFYANGKWKKYEQLTKGDNLYVLSNLMEKCTNVIQMGNIQTTISTSGNLEEFTILKDFIERFGNFITDLYQKDVISTTKMAILSTTLLTICKSLQIVSIAKYMEFLLNSIKSIQNIVVKSNIAKKIGHRVEKLLLTACNQNLKYVSGVAKSLLQRMSIKDSAMKNAIINGNTTLLQTLLKLSVACAEKLLCKINTFDNHVVVNNAHMNFRGIKGVKNKSRYIDLVYDLVVGDCHEYFANGVLVHNCDPTTFIGVIISGDDIYARELHYQMGMKTKDIAEALEPYAGNYKYCDIDNRLVSELEDAGIPLLTMTKKNSESIMSGIRLMNQRKIHITTSSNDLIKELRNYVYKKDRHDTYQTNVRPIDKFNHCFDYQTLIATSEGYKCIGEIKVGDMVYNSQGLFPVQKIFRNGVQEIWDLMIEYENGSKTELSVTPNHKIKTKYGWKQVQELTTGDTVYLLKSSMEKHISSITEKDTFQEEQKDFMSQYGNFTMAQSLKDSIFITKMKTHGIILSKILSAFKVLNTYLCTFKKKCKILLSWKNLGSEWTTQEHTQVNGTVAEKVLNGIKSTGKESQRTCSQENTPAYIAERNSGKNHSEKISSAPINVNQHGEESRAMIMKREYVNTAEKNLQPTSTAGQNFVEEVVVKSMCIKSKRNAKTYNLMITDVHEYIAHNLLVSNCIDALRYVVYAECGGINGESNEDRYLSKEDLGIFM